MAKESSNSEVVRNIGKCVKVFGIVCVSCQSTDVTLLTVEHFVAKTKFATLKDANHKNLYPACYGCNNNKSTMPAEKFFAFQPETYEYIKAKLETTELSDADILEGIADYVKAIIEASKVKPNYSISSLVLNLLTDRQLKPFLGELNFDGAKIRTKQDIIQRLSKHYDLSKARIVAT